MGKKKKVERDTSIPSDIELLMELGTLDHVEAYVPTSAEADAGVTPQWCELVLKMTREADSSVKNGPGTWPMKSVMVLRRHDGEMIAEVLREVLHPQRSTRPLDYMWEALDECVESIQRRVGKGRDPMKADVGKAQGLTFAIAVVMNPIEPDEDEVRELAMERYEIRHGLQE